MLILSQSSFDLLYQPTIIRLRFSCMRQKTQNNSVLNAMETYFSLVISKRFWSVHYLSVFQILVPLSLHLALEFRVYCGC